MDAIDHEIQVFLTGFECSCGDGRHTPTGAQALAKAYQHAKKFLGHSRVIDTRIDWGK